MELNYSFPTDHQSILDKLASYDPSSYARSRNFIDGAVSELSPYISRGVLSTRNVFEHLLNAGYEPQQIEKYLQELAWRDYLQLIWIEQQSSIDGDLRYPQDKVRSKAVPEVIIQARTGITAIDASIKALISGGYMHNHLRMYVASICCNVAKSHWLRSAQWMYYYLLDGDWASNALSWQWVAGSFSNRNYIANQENINKYCHTQDKDTFLDRSYEEIAKMTVPEVLMTYADPKLITSLPASDEMDLRPELPTYIYNWYNLDSQWDIEVEANRVLLLEPEIFDRYPISEQSVAFMMGLAKNIPDVQIFVGSFDDLKESVSGKVHFKEHPLNSHYIGIEHSRDWLTGVTGEYRSFFQYWKKAKKELF